MQRLSLEQELLSLGFGTIRRMSPLLLLYEDFEQPLMISFFLGTRKRDPFD